MDIAETSAMNLAHTEPSKPIRGVSVTNQPPDAIRQLIRQWLTDEEAEKILSRFQNACIPNRQVFWSGMLREQAQQWADTHGLQTLTTALGPLLDASNPKYAHRQARSRYIHGASIIFAWFVSQGDLVIVLSHPPPLLFHPSGQTFYQLYEEPILKGKMGNRPVGRIYTAHPAVEIASDFIYQLWPYNISWFWIKTFGIPDIEFPWRKTKTVKPTTQPGPNLSSASLLASKTPETTGPGKKSVADTNNKITKGEQQKTKKTKKKKMSSAAVVDQGKSPTTKKSPKSGTSSNKQPLTKTAVISKKKNVNSSIKIKAKKKKKKQEQKVAIVEKAQDQLNAKQGQKKPTTTAKTKGSKKREKAKSTIKSVMKNGK